MDTDSTLQRLSKLTKPQDLKELPNLCLDFRVVPTAIHTKQTTVTTDKRITTTARVHRVKATAEIVVGGIAELKIV